MPTAFFLPLITLLVSIFSLFTDIDKPRGRKAAGVLVVLLILACAFQIKESSDSDKDSTWQKAQIEKLTTALENFKAETGNSLEEILSRLQSFGSTNENPTIGDIKQSLEADRNRTQLAEATNPSLRQQITVEYFPKNVDRKIVENSLRELGFNLTPGTPTLPNEPTNAIWFGNAVPIEDVKLVAYTLIRAGVKIRAIRSFENPGGDKAKLIQVGSSMKSRLDPPLSVERIQSENSFTQ